jgi:phosphofructokinase-like protein
MRFGILTGGGDAPGLNAAIRAVARRAFQGGDDVLGIRNGWQGLLGEGQADPLTGRDVSGILHVGGTILGTSRTNPLARPDGLDQVCASLQRWAVDALVVIGGDDTLSVAGALHRLGVPVVGLPKTVDNDLPGTDYCIGFNTAVDTVREALDKLHTTASAHHRVLVVEVMGREAGWVALMGGLAGGADMILIPEVAVSIEQVCAHLERRRGGGKDFSIIVVSEGVETQGLVAADSPGQADEFGNVRLDRRSVGDRLARAIERVTGLETRVTVLGHLQRGGPPNAYDRVMATRVGVAGVDLARQGRRGLLVAVQGGRIAPVPLEDIVGKTRLVDPELYAIAEIFF